MTGPKWFALVGIYPPSLNDGVYSPTIEEVLPWVCAYWDMEGNGTGGNLHVMLDDCNVEDGTCGWTQGYCDASGDRMGSLIAGWVRMMPWPRRVKLSHAVGDIVYAADFKNVRRRIVWPSKWHYGRDLPPVEEAG